VLGAGPIGALTVAALRARGVADVTCAEPGEHRRALARAVGATATCHPADLEVPSVAEPGRVVDAAVDVVLECSGPRAAMEAGLAQLVRGGTLVLIGAGPAPVRPQPHPAQRAGRHRGVQLRRRWLRGGPGAAGVGPPAGRRAARTRGSWPLDGLLDAMVGLAEGRLAGKVLVQP
jgi:threonine dehydrogenase-like Zn-dependent dehydrogenase